MYLLAGLTAVPRKSVCTGHPPSLSASVGQVRNSNPASKRRETASNVAEVIYPEPAEGQEVRTYLLGNISLNLSYRI